MRFLKLLVSIVLIGYTQSLLALQITATELVQLQHAVEHQSLDRILFESADELEKHLQDLSVSQSIWLKHQWLRKLSMLTHPTAEQRRWLQSQLSSNESLTITDPDHPNKQLVVIKIAQQAMASLQHWKINQQVELFQKHWGTAEWRWQDLVSPQNEVLQKAFSQWIRGAGQTIAAQVAEGYLTQVNDLIPSQNNLLALLAEHGRSAELYELLWKNTADEFSYQALAKLPVIFEESVVIEQTLQANNNAKLQSQALFLLAKRYSHNVKAQQTLLTTLDHSETRWIAVAVLNKITDKTFLADLDKKVSQQKPSSFRTLAMKKIRQAAENGVAL